jgi:hypothetical protein
MIDSIGEGYVCRYLSEITIIGVWIAHSGN